MLRESRDVIAGSLGDLARSWRTFALTDLAYKLLAFGVLTPATALLMRWLLRRGGSGFVADADIARFLLTTPSGVAALLFGSAIVVAITFVECACLMAVENGAGNVRSAIAFGTTRGVSILRLAFRIVLRVIAAVAVLLIAIGLIYAVLLREHDINYYLSSIPPVFMLAVVIAGAIGTVFAVIAARAIVRWALSLPLVLFENTNPRIALKESTQRSKGHEKLIALVLAIWLGIALIIGAMLSGLIALIGRAITPLASGSVALLVTLLTAIVIVWIAASIAAAVFNASLFSIAIVRLWRVISSAKDTRTELPATGPLPRSMKFALFAAAILLAGGAAMLALVVTGRNERVFVIAHRGASKEAPENSLAAFRAAVAHGADYVELDVQESLDGEVIVVHDKDLMKAGGSPMKVWEHTAAELRTVSLGGTSEHVPTLTEALEVCRGSRSKVLVELKFYGHSTRLEERVANVVEAAGMTNGCAYMSLNHDMVREMKRIRPSWRVGALVAKTVGDPTTLGADFLAVASGALTPKLVRRAHRAKQDVYVWTVNDPASMLAMASRGADGLITDVPGVAKEVLQRRSAMSDAQRLLVAILIRAGARTESLEDEAALRP